MQPHVHISPIHMFATLLAMIALFGTLHLLAMTAENSRWARAMLALGF